MSELLTISDKGQITIPMRLRKELRLKPGDKVYCDAANGALVCRKPLDFFSLRGCLGKAGMPEDAGELFAGAAARALGKGR